MLVERRMDPHDTIQRQLPAFRKVPIVAAYDLEVGTSLSHAAGPASRDEESGAALRIRNVQKCTVTLGTTAPRTQGPPKWRTADGGNSALVRVNFGVKIHERW